MVCANTPTFSLTCKAEAKTAGGADAIGVYQYQWVQDGVDIAGETDEIYRVPDYDPVNPQVPKNFQCKVKFIDLYEDEKDITTPVCVVSFNQALRIGIEPNDLALTGNPADQEVGQISIQVDQVSSDLPAITPVYAWFVNNTQITGDSIPDTGYVFANWTTASLTVTRLANTTPNDALVYCKVSGGLCNDSGIISSNATISGGGSSINPPGGPFPEANGVGAYYITDINYLWETKLEVNEVFTANNVKAVDNWDLDGQWRVMTRHRYSAPDGPFYYYLFLRIA